jgi:hypothetical protein
MDQNWLRSMETMSIRALLAGGIGSCLVFITGLLGVPVHSFVAPFATDATQ